MGRYICEFGYTHKVCRCLKEHTIKCDKLSEHKPQDEYVPKHRKGDDE